MGTLPTPPQQGAWGSNGNKVDPMDYYGLWTPLTELAKTRMIGRGGKEVKGEEQEVQGK